VEIFVAKKQVRKKLRVGVYIRQSAPKILILCILLLFNFLFAIINEKKSCMIFTINKLYRLQLLINKKENCTENDYVSRYVLETNMLVAL